MSYDNSVAKGDLSFGLSLMSHLGDGNVPISPTSIRTALAMLYEGAKGATAKQISQVAVLPEDASARQEGFRELTDALNSANTPYTVRCANGVWVAEKYPMNPDFKSILTNSYRAEAQSANFEGNPGGERTKINNWVDGKTEGKIPGLFSDGSINPSTILVLANALYFKAPWDNKFDPQYTRKQDYTLSSGETVQVDMMRKGQIDSSGQLPEFWYGQFDGVQVVMLPYEGHNLLAKIFMSPSKGSSVKGLELAKMIMLPPKGSSVKGLEAQLRDSQMNFMDLHEMLRLGKFARLEIPKHEVRGDYDLEAPLRAMGIDRIFALDTAELSGIGPGPLFVNKGVHKTYFKTDEEGSEGAAATGFATMKGGDPRKPVEFVADRPFLEAVVDNETGAFLFLNRIEDPR